MDASDCLALIEAVRAKGHTFKIETEPNEYYFVNLYSSRKQDSGEPWTYYAEEKTLTKAVANAVLKLIHGT